MLIGVSWSLAAALLLWAAGRWPAALAAPTSGGVRISRTEGMNYLSKFGYISPSLGLEGEDTAKLVSAALKSFQRMARLNETGDIDASTADMMAKPRCGNHDPTRIGGGEGARSKRYLHAGTKWNLATKPVLTWRVLRYTNQLAQADVDRELERALQVWADVTPLKFEKRSSGPVDIEIVFAASYHSDAYPFDGRGGTLAHAYYPPAGDLGFTINGDTHFDESEQWTIASRSGVNLFYVAVHEFGHALGLQHSNVVGSIMWPWAGGFDPNNTLRLAYDDIIGIQSLYGGRPRGGATTANPTTPTRTPSAAAVTTTASTATARSTTRAATTTTTARTTTRTTTTTTSPPPRPTQPTARATMTAARASPTTTTVRAPPTTTRATTTALPTQRAVTTRATAPSGGGGATARVTAAAARTTTSAANGGDECPDRLDEIVEAVDGHVYGFRGGSVYRFLARAPGVDDGFPKHISAVFPQAPPDGVDAAVTFQGPFAHAKTYLFKGDRYYRYSVADGESGSGSRMVLDQGFPKAIADGWGLRERDFDAVFLLSDPRSLYFVKGNRYWRHIGTTRGVLPGYPRSMSSHGLLRRLSGVSAAFRRSTGLTYFFEGTQYFRYAERTDSWVGPRPTGLWWFGCVLDRLRAPSMSDMDGSGDSGSDPR